MMAIVLMICLVPVVLVVVSYAVGWWEWSRLRRRLRNSADSIADDWGWAIAGMTALAVGASVTMAIMMSLGEVVQRMEPSVDVPLYEAMANAAGPWLTSVAEVTTQMGNRTQTKIIAVVFSLGLILVPRFRGRDFWIPAVAIWGAYGVEKILQESLAAIVDRGHPPTTLGTFPSGGVARIVVVWGMVAFLIWIATSNRSRLMGTWLVLVVAVAAGIESFSRIVLLQHWATDVFASWVFGPLVLIAATSAIFVVLERRADRNPLWVGFAAR